MSPEKKKRNGQIKLLTDELNAMLADVLKETGIKDQVNLHPLIGGKNREFADVYSRRIKTPEEFVSVWCEGFQKATTGWGAGFQNLRGHLGRSPLLQKYTFIFLKRTFLREFDVLSRSRPDADSAFVWMGNNKAIYGLFIQPVFSKLTGQWINDRSEIRRFKKRYWTIGHVLETGLVIPGENRKMSFSSVNEYLNFFVATMVRGTGSPHEMALAKLYEAYVLKSDDPEDVPLLLHDIRYDGLEKDHKYRLDFAVYTEGTKWPRVGFELSPWSTHGHLAGTAGKSQKEINEEARANYEKEMKKSKDFFQNRGVYTQSFTDEDLQDHKKIFAIVKKHLEAEEESLEINAEAVRSVLGKDVLKMI